MRETTDESSQPQPPFDNTVPVIGWALFTGGPLTGLTWCGLRTVAVAFGSVVLVAGLALLIANGIGTRPPGLGAVSATGGMWSPRSRRARYCLGSCISSRRLAAGTGRTVASSGCFALG